ncbi:pyridoxal-phosphate dependent enzyme [Alisedimentitalea sp. MJ-SS2]|uniref:pyridoxal-phosphate dependent enzyme n=1 Tax=Aliisedimentitalea sp. MJ-SS2 TaxID=3049795 RepID=UPI00290BDE82|nr:pyridoxal-phosphate dependent enzyme [Alisedimentitalea sp. MJ-SS2]MDU8929758.1 pyridoxal-phosphate dependent enzyme [Alisedimentitalea sp. MJ-SS2]
MQVYDNPHSGQGLDHDSLSEVPFPSVDANAVGALLARCPLAEATPLTRLEDFGGAGEVFVKDERFRMTLGSFKALGAAYAIARDAEEGKAKGRTYVCASAGNHGLSVTAGALAFGAKAVIYLAESVPQDFQDRLEAFEATVVREGAIYEESMAAAQKAAEENGWELLSDSSWPGYMERPFRVMEGYLALADETVREMGEPPTHIFLQAGVGGLAGACAAYFREKWGSEPKIIVVEPEAAPALLESVKAGRCVETQGPVSSMGRLDCKEPSLIALKGLARDADRFTLISEEEAEAAMPVLTEAGLESTPSGGAGLAALLAGEPLGPEARVLCILSEAPE